MLTFRKGLLPWQDCLAEGGIAKNEWEAIQKAVSLPSTPVPRGSQRKVWWQETGTLHSICREGELLSAILALPLTSTKLSKGGHHLFIWSCLPESFHDAVSWISFKSLFASPSPFGPPPLTHIATVIEPKYMQIKQSQILL